MAAWPRPCLTLTEEHVERLELFPGRRRLLAPPHRQHQRVPGVTMVSPPPIAARVKSPSTQREAIRLVTPGHLFRLRRGGVLVRTGHTEGSVDLASLAGRAPAGVICEIMNDDGTMARLPDLELFAKTHGLMVLSIADLIQYRLQTERSSFAERAVLDVSAASGSVAYDILGEGGSSGLGEAAARLWKLTACTWLAVGAVRSTLTTAPTFANRFA
jgi:hypothetical protein